MSVWTVSSASQLSAAISSAPGGDVMPVLVASLPKRMVQLRVYDLKATRARTWIRRAASACFAYSLNDGDLVRLGGNGVANNTVASVGLAFQIGCT